MFERIKIEECKIDDYITHVLNNKILTEATLQSKIFTKIINIESGNWMGSLECEDCVEITFQNINTHCIFPLSSFVYRKTKHNISSNISDEDFHRFFIDNSANSIGYDDIKYKNCFCIICILSFISSINQLIQLIISLFINQDSYNSYGSYENQIYRD